MTDAQTAREAIEAIRARLAKIQPIDEHVVRNRYDHGGGRMYRVVPRSRVTALDDGKDRSLILDVYEEGDREFYFSAAEDIATLLRQLEAVEKRAAIDVMLYENDSEAAHAAFDRLTAERDALAAEVATLRAQQTNTLAWIESYYGSVLFAAGCPCEGPMKCPLHGGPPPLHAPQPGDRPRAEQKWQPLTPCARARQRRAPAQARREKGSHD